VATDVGGNGRGLDNKQARNVAKAGAAKAVCFSSPWVFQLALSNII